MLLVKKGIGQYNYSYFMIYLFTLGSGHSSENTYGEINISVEVTNVISILSYFGDLL